MKKAQNEEVDQAVYVWLMQKRAMGQPISCPLLCEKALHFNARLGGNPSFRATTGWLHKFKKRHGIREIEIHGKQMSADESSARFPAYTQAFYDAGDLALRYVKRQTNFNALTTRRITLIVKVLLPALFHLEPANLSDADEELPVVESMSHAFVVTFTPLIIAKSVVELIVVGQGTKDVRIEVVGVDKAIQEEEVAQKQLLRHQWQTLALDVRFPVSTSAFKVLT
ncbi:centromere binding protein B, DNA binding protein [Trichuris suis]|nr:centromere binding protein B, DNA binding protein [Trichuris suis]